MKAVGYGCVDCAGVWDSRVVVLSDSNQAV